MNSGTDTSNLTPGQVEVVQEVMRQINERWQTMFSVERINTVGPIPDPPSTREAAHSAKWLKFQYHQARQKVSKLGGPFGQYFPPDHFKLSRNPKMEPIWVTVSAWQDWYFGPGIEHANKVVAGILHAIKQKPECATDAHQLLKRLGESTVEPDYQPGAKLLGEAILFIHTYLHVDDPVDPYQQPLSPEEMQAILDTAYEPSELALKCLVTLIQLGAVSEKTRRKADQVAQELLGHQHDATPIKREMAKLSAYGLVEAKVGRGGGSWVTEEGVLYVHDRQEDK